MRDKKEEINKQPISAMAGLKKSIRNNELKKEREREETLSCENKKEKKGTNTCRSLKQCGPLRLDSGAS